MSAIPAPAKARSSIYCRGLYDVTEGELLIDGINIKKIPLEVLRSHVGCVPQETFLFSESISENISYGVDGMSHEQIREAAEISQIAKDVNDFPQQFETALGERGITLSGGQKQRTSIARAVLREPKILILDDALSSVDTYTEEAILKRLRRVMENRTSIIISHRISTVKDADMIIVMDKGRDRRTGTPRRTCRTRRHLCEPALQAAAGEGIRANQLKIKNAK